METLLVTVADSINGQLAFLLSPEVRLPPRLEDVLRRFQQTTIARIRTIVARLELEVGPGPDYDSKVFKTCNALHDAEDILDDLLTEVSSQEVSKASLLGKVCFCFSAARQFYATLEVTPQIRVLEDKIRTASCSIGVVLVPDRIHDDESGWVDVVIGRDNDKEKVMDFLLFNNNDSNWSNDSPVPVLAIVGIGGIGKTTLARLVFNEERVSHHFEVRVWVTVSSKGDFDVFREVIAMEILQQTHKGSTAEVVHDDMDVSQLRQVIDGKRFLLVLDDVWNPSTIRWPLLHALLNVVGSQGSKILVTSRDMRVAKITNAPFIHVLEGLSEEESLSLAMKIRDRTHRSFSTETLLKCAGVPLAIITAGKNLRISYRGDFSLVLKPSYDALPLHLKQYVAYCSLFPRDYVLDVHELTNIWKAQLARQLTDLRETSEEFGQEFIRDLASLFFLTDLVKDEYGNIVGCKMHPLFHDLARVMTKGCCTYFDSKLLLEVDASLHVSINMKRDHLEVLGSAENARTLIFLNKRGHHIGEPVIEYIFTNLKKLRALRLRGLSVSAVSNLLGTLRYLRYLDLSESGRLEALPVSIGELLNLETLILKNCCSLKELPSGIIKVIKLQELDLSGCSSLTHLPSGIEQLINLKKLDLSGCSSLTHLPSGIEQLINLRKLDLSGCSSLTHLPSGIARLINLRELDFSGCSSLTYLPSSIQRLMNLQTLGWCVIMCREKEEGLRFVTDVPEEMPNLQSLKLSWDSSDVNFHGAWGATTTTTAESVLRQLRLHPNLKRILIQGCCEYDVNSALSQQLSRLSNLVQIDIRDCDWCTNLPPLHYLPCLKIVKLGEMKELDYFGTLESSRDTEGGGRLFPALEVLSLKYLHKLKGWQRTGAETEELGDDMMMFPTFSAEIHLDVDHTRSFSYAHGRDSLTLATLTDRIVQCWERENIIRGKGKEKASSSSGSSVSKFQSLPGLVRVIPFTSIYSISLAQLKSIKIQDMGDIKSLTDEFFQQLPSLQHLEISHGRFLTTLSGLQHLNALETLKIVDFPELDFSRLENDDTEESSARFRGRPSKLCRVCIGAVPKMESLPWWFQHLTELEELVISDCVGLRTLQDDSISKLTSLKSLEIYGCGGLRYISKGVILHLVCTLKSLKICGCPELDITAGPAEDITAGPAEDITLQSQRPSKLRHVHIQQNNRMKRLPWWIQHLGRLEILEILFCKNLEILPHYLSKLASLQEIRIEYCGKLSELCRAKIVHVTSIFYLPKISRSPMMGMLFRASEAAKRNRKAEYMVLVKLYSQYGVAKREREKRFLSLVSGSGSGSSFCQLHSDRVFHLPKHINNIILRRRLNKRRPSLDELLRIWADSAKRGARSVFS